ncbi:MAG TPA: LytTR family DNA-binding domain-containing protein [Bacteroidales bacterium]|nr:LytTR family DNA-binding domain-containing protein [Bacteroidales bacterium]HPS18255.1 LytTR family DNA-binding domain-containing protein [Bacteroidales bacterium]
MFKFLNKSYPYNDDLKYNSIIIFFISIGVFLFLFLFQPFNISSLETRDKYYLMLGLCLITFLALTINLLFFPSIFPRMFSNTKWDIKREILWNVWILFTISSGYYLFCKKIGILVFGYNLVIALLLVAVFPISALIIINHSRILRLHLNFATELNKKLQESKHIEEKIVHFDSDYQKDSLSIKVSLILFIRSANNYIEVFWKENGTVKSQLVRCSLTKAEEILKEDKFIFKCHRSYLANIKLIEKVEGNLQGYKLFFENVDFSIPVSKNFANKLNELL